MVAGGPVLILNRIHYRPRSGKIIDVVASVHPSLVVGQILCQIGLITFGQGYLIFRVGLHRAIGEISGVFELL